MSAAGVQEKLEPGTEPWLRLMTSSKVAAILGVSPWDSPRSMWHKMRNELLKPAETDVQARGHYLEPAILAWWRDQHPEFVRVEAAPTMLLGDWAAASPDMRAWTVDDTSAIVEAKSGRDLDEWGTPGTDEIPPYYLTQVFWELHVSGDKVCYVPIIGPFLDFAEYVVTYDAEIGAALEARCREFYDSLSDDRPPPLDDSVATYDALRVLHRSLDEQRVIEVTPAIAREYVEALNARKDAEARERAAKSTVLDLMGDARYAECSGIRVARRQPNKTGFQLNQVAKTTTDFPDEGTQP